MQVCAKCGKELREGAAFCPRCGTKVAIAEQPENKTSIAAEDLLAAKTIVIDDRVSSAQSARSDDGERQEFSVSSPSVTEEMPPSPAGVPISPAQAANQAVPANPSAPPLAEQPKPPKKKRVVKVIVIVLAALVVVVAAVSFMTCSNQPKYTETAESVYDVENFASMDASHMLAYLDEQGFEEANQDLRNLFGFESDEGSAFVALTDYGKSLPMMENLLQSGYINDDKTVSVPEVEGKTPALIAVGLYDQGENAEEGFMSRSELEEGKTQAGGEVGSLYIFESRPNEDQAISFMQSFIEQCKLDNAKHVFKSNADFDNTEYKMIGEGEMFGQPCFYEMSCTVPQFGQSDVPVMTDIVFVTASSFKEVTNTSSLDAYADFLNEDFTYTEIEF